MTEIFDNIRKLYRFYTPTNELAQHIEFFSESSAEETYQHVASNPFTVRMFPSWTPTCYINLGEPYQMVVGANRYLIQKDADVLLLRNSIVERFNLPTDHIFTIKFYPGGLEAILGINQVQLVDQVVRLETILPVALIQRVKQLNEFAERIELLESFFLSQYVSRKRADHYRTIVTNTIGTFEASGLVFNPGQLADRTFVTAKTINRYFHRVVGVSPKQYLSSVRVRAALTGYVANRTQFSPDDFGYYDMSHFYKDVVRFTGQKLSECL
ncbi:hypothetical protein GCM10027341_11390 [Spirosoma knui]